MASIEYNSVQYSESREIKPGVRMLKALKMIGKNKKVLDVGCFDGFISRTIADAGNDVYGVDASKPAVARALRKGIKASVGNIEEGLSFDDASFDVVFAGPPASSQCDTRRVA